jgi:hypothetical protein
MIKQRGRDENGKPLKVRCEVYSRGVGFLRPVSWWPKHKQGEFQDRATYIMPEGEADGKE